MAKSIPGQLSMFSLWNSEDLPNAISLQESVGGDMPSVLPDGQTTGRSGPDPARANRSRSQARAPVQTIQGTCGPTSIASSLPIGPLSSWESKLRDRLAMVGSTECALIWREKVTPAGESISRLARWTPPTSASGSTGLLQTWRTPATTEPGVTLERLETADGQPWTPGQRAYDKHTGRVAQIGLTHEVLATWPTPDTMNHRDGSQDRIPAPGRQPGTAHGMSLHHAAYRMATATWPTPTTNQFEGGDPQKLMNRKQAMQEKHNNGNGFGLTLGQMVLVDQAFGPITSGSPEPTANRGALNPAFPCWLMGYPTAWDACAPTVTPSSRRLRQK